MAEPTLPLGRIQPSLPMLRKDRATKRDVQAAEFHAHHEDNVRRAGNALSRGEAPADNGPSYPTPGQTLFNFKTPDAGPLVIDEDHNASIVDNKHAGDVSRRDIAVSTYKNYGPQMAAKSESIWATNSEVQEMPKDTIFDTRQRPEGKRYNIDDSPLASAMPDDFKNGSITPPSVLKEPDGSLVPLDGHHRLARQRQLGMDPVVRVLSRGQFDTAYKNKDF